MKEITHQQDEQTKREKDDFVIEECERCKTENVCEWKETVTDRKREKKNEKGKKSERAYSVRARMFDEMKAESMQGIFQIVKTR